MLLSSVERVSRFLCVDLSTANKRILNNYLLAVSNQIEAYLGINFELVERTEYFDIKNVEREFWLTGVPLSSITNVYHDSDGFFDGAETTLTTSEFHAGKDNRSIVLDYSLIPGKRALKVVYIGGVSSTATKSTFAISSVLGTFVKDKYITGSVSGAVGIIQTTTAATSIQINTLYGKFVVGETLTMQNDEGGTDVVNVSAVISSITVQSLSEILPEVFLACDIQLRYNIKTKDDFELTNVDKDGTTRRPSQHYLTYDGKFNDLQPEVRSMINGLKRIRL